MKKIFLIPVLLTLGLAGCAPMEGAAPSATPAPPPVTAAPTATPVATTPSPTPVIPSAAPIPSQGVGEEAEASTQAEIPQELLEQLLEMAAEDSWEPFVEERAAGRTLEGDELVSVWNELGGVRGESWDGTELMSYHTGAALDLDQDGTEDMLLAVEEGSGRFLSFRFYRGLPEGGYALAEHGMLGNRPHFFAWAGANYLLVPWYNNDTYRLGGLSLWLFHDGVCVRRARLDCRVEDYRVAGSWAAEGYEAVRASLEEGAAELWTAFDETERQPVGNAERAVDGEGRSFACDLDNDGVEETYEKWTSYVTWGRDLFLADAADGDSQWLLDLTDCAWPQAFWAEEWDGETLVFALAPTWEDGTVRFSACRNAGGARETVATLILEAELTAELVYYGDDPDFDWY